MKRRNYLTGTGFVAASALAGCAGITGNGNNDTRTIRITMGPGGFQGMVVDYLTNQTSILRDNIESAGDYDVQIQPSWEGSTLFASGGPDFSSVGPFEAAKLAAERDLELSVNAKVAPNYVSWFTRAGGPYDPAETGSVQASIDRMYEDGARHGHGSWGSGHVAADKYINREVYGHTFEEGGELDVVTTDYSSIPQLIVDEELDSGANWFYANTQQVQDPPQLAHLYACYSAVRDNDLGVNALNAWTTTQEFADTHSAALEAYLESWQEGIDWLFDDPMGTVMGDEDYWDQINAETEEEARWSVEWALLGEHDIDFPVVFDDISMSDDWLASNETFIDNAASIGEVTEDWRDYINYNSVL
jgi:hypothetical protein